jgi:hypothetical protein
MDNQNNFVDNTHGMGYNDSNNAINEAVVNHYLSRVDVIKMDEQKPINDTSCQHDNLVADAEDSLDDGSVYHGCTNLKCGVGFYIQPTIK